MLYLKDRYKEQQNPGDASGGSTVQKLSGSVSTGITQQPQG